MAEGNRVSGVEIQLDGVTKRFAGQSRPAVQDVTMTIPAGEIVVLVGPSGCGKTTTMKMINRLIEPTSGAITIGGRNALSLNPDQLRRQIGYAIQQAGLFPHMTVAQNIGVVPNLLGWSKPTVAARIEEMLELVGLEPREFAGRYPRKLSGGQQQRVGVARALAADPPVLLMDEPFGAVDPITRGNLQDELMSLQAELRKTIVFVTHDFNEAIKLGDRIAVLGPSSAILQYDTPQAILANPADDTVAGFIGADASLKQLSLLRVRDVTVGEACTATEAESPATVAERMVKAGRKFALLLDNRRRPLRWLHQRDVSGVDSFTGRGVPVGDLVSRQSTLQDALEAILTEGGTAVVVKARGEYDGVVGIDTVMATIRQLREEHGVDTPDAGTPDAETPHAGTPDGGTPDGQGGSAS